MRVLICDQDEDYMEELKRDLESLECDEELIFESFNNIETAEYRLRFDEFDMAFINGVVNGENGIELAKKVKERFPDIFLFLNCDNYDFIHDAFTIRAFQLLIKHNFQLLKKNFARAMDVHHQRHLQLPFMTIYLERHFFVPEEILYVETGKIPSKIVTVHCTYYGEFDNMISLKKQLIDHYFFQVHQSYFVNLKHVRCIRRGEMIMDNGDSVPTSTYNKVFVDQAVQRYMNSR